MKQTKKILTITAIASTCLAILMLIGAIFGLDVFSGFGLYLLLSLGTIAVASAFAISAVSFLRIKPIVSYVCLGLLGVLTLFALILYWAPIPTGSWFTRITGVLAIATVFFNIIISFYIKLGNKQKPLQLATYILVVIVDVVLTLLVCGINLFKYGGVWQGFAVICLIVLALMCTLGIMAKKNYTADDAEASIEGDKYIRIRQSEYNEMKARIAQLEEELKHKK